MEAVIPQACGIFSAMLLMRRCYYLQLVGAFCGTGTKEFTLKAIQK